MMNFVLSSFVWALKFLEMHTLEATQQALSGVLEIPPAEKQRIQNSIQFITDQCRRMRLTGAENRLGRIATAFRQGTNYAGLAQELKVLREAIDDDIQYERFYHYPKEAGNLLLRYTVDWAATLAAYPSKDMDLEIKSAVDCMALTQPTAAIFHFMRIAEFGLRALARDQRVKLPKYAIEWATWQELIREIENQVKKINAKPRSAKKDAALEFYNGALAGFSGFKDMYRNSVMHIRKAYELPDAEMAMRQVRDFMNRLSAKIGEQTKHPIKWGV